MTGKLLSEHFGEFYADGEWRTPTGVDWYTVRKASTEEPYFSVRAAGPADVELAVDAARRAFDETDWPRLPVRERADYVRRFGEAVRARADDFIDLWIAQTGVVRTFAETLLRAPNNFDSTARLVDEMDFEEVRPSSVPGASQGLLVREPVGVVAAIIPWNVPAWSIAIKAAPALLAGCTVVVKAAPEAPGDAYLMAEIAEEIGLPRGVFNFVTADRDVSELLVRNPKIDKIAFTGSVAAGQRIAAIAGGRTARVSLELGGKSPALILDDYDVGAAATEIAAKMPLVSGQVCTALTRIVVDRKRYDDMVDALAEQFSAVQVGDPYDSATQMGPVANQRQYERVMGWIETGRAEGGRIAAGGGRPADMNRGYFVEPTVIADLDNQAATARNEIFGPVVNVIACDGEEDAIAIANDSPFGLNASVFTQDPDRAYKVARRLHAGSVGHNGWKTDHTIAFGGFKQSGLGREGGQEGIHEFLETKTITMVDPPPHTANAG